MSASLQSESGASLAAHIMRILAARSVFRLGQVVATPAALDAVPIDRLGECLKAHAQGDWGVVGEHDRQTNERALRAGDRLLSAYPIDPQKPCAGFGENTLWIITEWDRSVTTVLLPADY
jgi:hypothetical protein